MKWSEMRGRTGWPPLLAAVLVAALFQVVLIAWPAGSLLVSNAVLLAATAGATVATGLRARRERGPSRWVWRLAAAATLCWFASRVLYLPDEVIHGRQLEHPAASDVPTFMAYGLAVAVALAMPWAHTSAASRLRAVLDGVMFTSALLGLAWVFGISDLYQDDGGGRFGSLALAYPTVATVVMSVALIMAGRRPPGDAMALLCLAMATVAGGMSLNVILEMRAVDLGPAGLDGPMLLCALLFILAARMPVAQADARNLQDRSRIARALPLLPMLLLLVVGIWWWATVGTLPPVLGWCGVLALICLLARQTITIESNAALTRELRQQRGELAHQAVHDSLTGAGNRVLLYRQLRELLADEERRGAVLLVDLDGFKAVNDTYGHAAGDAVLVAVAGRLDSAAGERGVVTRLGGDEFVVLLYDVSEVETLAVAEDILSRLRGAVGVRGITLHVRASVGAAIIQPGSQADPDSLVQHADLALYEAKAAGKDCARVFAAGTQAAVADRLRLDADLRAALERDQFELFYQPIVDLADLPPALPDRRDRSADSETRPLRMTGAEALLRWRHPSRGLLTPPQFLDRAEAIKLMPELTRWSLHEACRQAARWGTSVNVNISASQVLDHALVSHVEDALDSSGLPADRLTLEITEHAVLADLTAAAGRLAAVKQLGVRLALDDFGTGYSSLTHLSRLAIDTLKIDKSFVDTVTDPDRPPMVEALLQVAGTLGLTPVAEGVEHAEQATRLAALGCRLAQGYHFARPMPADAVTREFVADRGQPITA